MIKKLAAMHTPYNVLLFVCYSTVAVIAATEAGLWDKANAYRAEQPHQEFVKDFERYLESNEDHPWCGTGRLEDTEVGYLVAEVGGDSLLIRVGDT